MFVFHYPRKSSKEKLSVTSHYPLTIFICVCVYIYIYVCNRYMYTYTHTYMDMYMYIITIYNSHINFSSSLSLPATTAATLPATSRLDGSEGRPLAGIAGIGGIGCRDLRKKDRRPEDIDIWVNYSNSLTWIKAIWGWFPLLTMISSEVAVRSL